MFLHELYVLSTGLPAEGVGGPGGEHLLQPSKLRADAQQQGNVYYVYMWVCMCMWMKDFCAMVVPLCFFVVVNALCYFYDPCQM